MKIKIQIILLLILFSGCRMLLNKKASKIGYEGYFDKNYEWVNTPSSVLPNEQQKLSFKQEFDSIPNQKLVEIQSEIDSMIYGRHCFRFIYNADKSRFLALFSLDEKDPSYKNFTRGGGTSYYKTNPVDSINHYNYALWGIVYNDKWYYYRDEMTSFYDSSIENAQKKFEAIMLFQRCKFFKFYKKENEEEFWEYVFGDFRSGRFEKVSKKNSKR